MALLDDCYFCSLSVAASVIGVYTLVAYVIAFIIETWWIVHAPVPLPSPAYVLCSGYVIVSIFSGILLRGLSVKKSLMLLLWLLVVAALSVPEALLVYFMSVHYWNIRSLYGLMELTCWICRAIINVSGMICVQSLYSAWQEEKAVLRRLRDLNMTRVIPNRRNSVSSQSGYAKSPATPPQPQILNNGALTFVTPLRRTPSVLSRPETPNVYLGTAPVPLVAPPWLTGVNEFNASQFDESLRGHQGPATRSLSLADLRSVDNSLVPDQPRKTMSVLDFPVEKRLLPQTQSLDRRLLKQPGYGTVRVRSDAYFSDRLMGAYFPARAVGPAIGRDVYGRNIHTFYPGKPNSRSKHSLGSDSDDFQKYRDIAL